MQITRRHHEDVLELELRGRFDAVWADHISEAIAEAIREGHHRLALNMAAVDFLTSMGISVLIKFHRQLTAIDGRLTIVSASPFVADILGTMKLDRLFGMEPLGKALPPEADKIQAADLESESSPRGGGLVCRVLGDPAPIAAGRCEPSHCFPVNLPPGVFALGVGTPGSGFADCQARAGEFLAVNGALAFLPTGHGSVPDHLVTQGDFVPNVQALHCLVCEGTLNVAFSFQAEQETNLSLLQLVERCFAECGGDTIGIVIAAESGGLVGASLRCSPAAENEGGLFQFPQIRDRMRFTSEKAFCSEVVLVAGVACRGAAGPLAPTVRPLGPDKFPQGHFHAAAFSYCPLRKQGITLADTVRGLFERESLRGLLHLIHDTRPLIGTGQSEFVRGTCWTAPIARTETQGERRLA